MNIEPRQFTILIARTNLDFGLVVGKKPYASCLQPLLELIIELSLHLNVMCIRTLSPHTLYR